MQKLFFNLTSACFQQARYVCVHLQGAALVAVRSLEKSYCKYNKLLIFFKTLLSHVLNIAMKFLRIK